MSQHGDGAGAAAALHAAIATLAATISSDWSGDDIVNGLFEVGMLAGDAGLDDAASAVMAAAERVAAMEPPLLDAPRCGVVCAEQVQQLPLLLMDTVGAGEGDAHDSLVLLAAWAETLGAAQAEPPPSVLGGADFPATVQADLPAGAQADFPATVQGDFAGLARGEFAISSYGEQAAAAPTDFHVTSMGDLAVDEPGAVPAEAGAPQTVGRDMLAVLGEELDAVALQVQESTAAIGQQTGEARVDEVMALSDYFERLAEACAGIGLAGLQAALQALAQGMTLAFAARGDGAAEDLLDSLRAMVPPLRSYCMAPDDEHAIVALASALAEPQWSLAEAGFDLEALGLGLAGVNLIDAAAPPRAQRETVASAAAASLLLPADLNAELLDGLLQELPVQTSAFTTAIAHVASGQGQAQDIETAKRAAHTLKGAANTVGIPGIANLTHHLEDILIALGEARRMPDAAVAALLVEAGDCLEGMNEAMQGQGPPPADRQAVLQRVLDLANHIDAHGIGAGMPALPERAAPDATDASAAPAADDPSFRAPIPVPAQAATDPVGAAAMVRVPADLLTELLRHASEAMISTARLRDQLERAIEGSTRLRVQNQSLQELISELEHLVDIRGLGMSRAAGANEFDELEFEEFNELHTVSRQLTEASTDARELAKEVGQQVEAMHESLEQHHQIQGAIHESVLQTRMAPVETVVPRLQRAVRQTSRLLDKEVVLDVVGAATLMDGNVLQALVDPLMHVLRNAIDHGLEDAQARIAAGKPAQGHITLNFAREGNSIVVRCRDDGSGLDHDAILRRAHAMGLVAAGQVLRPEEISRLILRHGFSTRDEASQISGRGIGMDAVLASVHQLKGTLLLHTDPGRGLTVELRLPVSLVASHALLVESHATRLAVSTGGIVDLVYVSADGLREHEGSLLARIGQDEVPLTDLETLLALPAERRPADVAGFPAVLVQLDTGAVRAVRLGRVIESRDIVMADFGRFVARIDGIVGATVLGDGTVAPVIDLRELASAGAGLMAWNRASAAAMAAQLPQAARQRSALVVDDSLSARRSTAQFVRDLGFEVRTAIDGLEAIGMLEAWVPDIIVTDLEMPRINGLELSAHVRSRATLRQVPVVMITSRSTDKHRQQALGAGVSRYLVKPFKDEELSASISELVAA